MVLFHLSRNRGLSLRDTPGIAKPTELVFGSLNTCDPCFNTPVEERMSETSLSGGSTFVPLCGSVCQSLWPCTPLLPIRGENAPLGDFTSTSAYTQLRFPMQINMGQMWCQQAGIKTCLQLLGTQRSSIS